MSETEVGANQEHVEPSTVSMSLVTSAARSGAADAREAAERAWNATALFTSRFVYTTCYTLSYGVVFPSMFLACAVPKNNMAVRGLIDGAHAAIEKVDEIRNASTAIAGDSAVPALAPV